MKNILQLLAVTDLNKSSVINAFYRMQDIPRDLVVVPNRELDKLSHSINITQQITK